MHASISGKTAIVTGGASFIGLAVVRQLVEQGARVVVADSNSQSKAQIEAVLGGRGCCLIGDVADDAYLASLVRTAIQEYQSLHLIVSAAAIYADDLLRTDRAGWRRAMDVNLFPAAILTNLAEPRLQGGASIVYVASVSGRVAQPNRLVYSVAKAGLLMLAKGAAQQLAPRGIRVNSVSPGWTWNRNMEKRWGTRAAADARAAPFQPLGRVADPEEVASAVLFLLSSDAAFITGTDLLVDGGYSAIGPEGAVQPHIAPTA